MVVNMNKHSDDLLLREVEAADFLKVSPATLQKYRYHGTGPCYIRLNAGRHGPIRYWRSELERWLVEGRVTPRGSGR